MDVSSLHRDRILLLHGFGEFSLGLNTLKLLTATESFFAACLLITESYLFLVGLILQLGH